VRIAITRYNEKVQSLNIEKKKFPQYWRNSGLIFTSLLSYSH